MSDNYTFHDCDGVHAKRDIGDKVKRGMNGVIVMDYLTGHDYEVEFFDDDNNTVAVTTVTSDDLVLDVKFKED